eukprot:2754095-Rhodomonas_salina.2
MTSENFPACGIPEVSTCSEMCGMAMRFPSRWIKVNHGYQLALLKMTLWEKRASLPVAASEEDLGRGIALHLNLNNDPSVCLPAFNPHGVTSGKS